VCVGNVAFTGEKGKVYMELVALCVCGGGECGSYWGEEKCIYGVSG